MCGQGHLSQIFSSLSNIDIFIICSLILCNVCKCCTFFHKYYHQLLLWSEQSFDIFIVVELFQLSNSVLGGLLWNGGTILLFLDSQSLGCQTFVNIQEDIGFHYPPPKIISQKGHIPVFPSVIVVYYNICH